MDPRKLEEALRRTGQRHPLLRGQVAETPLPTWQDVHPGPRLIQVGGQIPRPIPPIDPAREAGSRVFLRTGDGETAILFQLHHALCDGAGGIQAIREILTIYGNLSDNRPWDNGLPRLDPGLLVDRNRLGLASRNYLRHWYKQPLAAYGAAKFLTRRFAVLDPGQPPSRHEGGIPFPSIEGRWIEPETVAAIEAESRDAQVRSNTLLLGLLFAALDDWRREVAGKSEEDWIRILLPVNLRERKHTRMPAANRTTLVQIDRRRRDWASERAAYFQWINREVDIIREGKLDRLFLIMIRLMGASPGWLKRSAQRDVSRGTAIFTHLGEPFRWARRRSGQSSDKRRLPISHLELTEFDFVGPVRPGTPFNFSVQRVGQHMRWSVHWDPRQLDRSDVSWILDRLHLRIAHPTSD